MEARLNKTGHICTCLQIGCRDRRYQPSANTSWTANLNGRQSRLVWLNKRAHYQPRVHDLADQKVTNLKPVPRIGRPASLVELKSKS
ncbi:unnamed protein product [Protopolystoma xenopodis]|uniref:Uncharacterized protein n=1 Tax=Protopolystoma xenopodis TaxID=117903 RepID=A0A3S5AGU8_9PLAT|nr:unnamed protein product [Protopolystoma xenopodis]